MSEAVDLDAYFERIRWGGSTRPGYETLAGLLRAHMLHIPFENLDVLLRRRVHLELDPLQNKLVRAHRGGYCFEHATLFAAVLEQLGFEPMRHTARVIVFLPPHASPRTHMVLTVPTADGTFVADPGLGVLAPRTPIPLVDEVKVHDDNEVHWMAREQNHWTLRAKIGERVVDCWVSPLELDNLVDFEVGNHYTSTHPKSPFVNRIMLRALTPWGRVTVMDRDVTLWRAGTPHAHQLADRAALRRLLAEHFGFDLPGVERLRVVSIPEWE